MDRPLSWPGPQRELARARREAQRDPVIRAIAPFVNRSEPIVRAEWRPALPASWTPQQPCSDKHLLEELDAPLFIAAERPRRLATEKAPFGLRIGGKSEHEMLAAIRRYVVNASQPQRCHYRSCAVVGSSGVLRGGHSGAAIDAHDAVIRINAAPTHSFEHAVGRRTTWRVHNSEKPYMLAASDVPELQVSVCHMAWIGSCQHQAFSGAYATTLAYVNPRFYSMLFSLLGRPRDKQSPSTGLLAIALAVGTCDHVSLYGFGNAGGPQPPAGRANRTAGPDAPSARCRHYWECPRWEDEGRYYDPLHTFHDWQAEERLRDLWVSAGLVSLGTDTFDPARVPRRNTTAVQAAWTDRRWQWARDLRALRRARADRRRRGIRPGTGTYDESTEAVLRRYSTLADPPAHRAGDTSSKGGNIGVLGHDAFISGPSQRSSFSMCEGLVKIWAK